MKRIGFLINPIAGMGGRVGLKGTDGVVDQARSLGAIPSAERKAARALRRLRSIMDDERNHLEVEWITGAGELGGDCLRAAGFAEIETAYRAVGETRREDTVRAVRAFLDMNVDLVLFCGGDGTARDIAGTA